MIYIINPSSYSLTLIDALDTLAVMGNYTEFRRISNLLINKGESFFDIDINVSVFETNIRSKLLVELLINVLVSNF